MNDRTWPFAKYLLAFVLPAFAGCAAAVGDEELEAEDVARTEQGLYLLGNTWPDGEIPVCWMSDDRGTARADFPELSGRIKQLLLNSWPAVADVEFTGWKTCPADAGGMVQIRLFDATGNQATRAYQGPNGEHIVRFGIEHSQFFRGMVPHEFGHVLGFAHEFERPDFPEGDCRDESGAEQQPGGDDLGTPADGESILASTYGGCQMNPLLSRWDRVGVREAYGTRAENVITAGSTLYARKLSNGDIYRRSGTSWTRIGGPGGQFLSVGSTLYALSPTGDDVYQYSGSGTNWTDVGNEAREILRCGASLCATNPTTGALYRREGSAWRKIGDQAAMYASTSTTLYRLTLERDAVQRYNDTGTSWTSIGVGGSAIYATTDKLFTVSPDGKLLIRYSGSGTTWSQAGGEGRTWVGVGNTLYGLSPGRSQVQRYAGTGTSWSLVGGPADWIYGGASGSLYATDPGSRDIYRYTGSGTSWERIGQP